MQRNRLINYPLNINLKPDPKPDSISGPAGSGRVADLPHMIVKRFGCIAIHNKAQYKCIIHSFIQN